MKIYDYLATVPLTDAQKEKVTEEGYENAATFYMMCKSIPKAIKEFLELDSLDAVEAALYALMTDEERQHVAEELEVLKSLGQVPPPREGM
jgi:hypothetical protein